MRVFTTCKGAADDNKERVCVRRDNASCAHLFIHFGHTYYAGGSRDRIATSQQLLSCSYRNQPAPTFSKQLVGNFV